MFRPVRKKKNEISIEEAKQLLIDTRRGVLGLIGVEGYPYGVPLNYLYDEETNKIYFHGARAGHKIEAIKACDKVCFTVYGHETIKKEEWAPFMQSTIVFGRCHLIEDQEAALKWVRNLARKYFPSEEIIETEVAASGHAVQMFEIEIEHMTGKEIQEY